MKATMNVFLGLLVLAIAGSLTACDLFTSPVSYSVFHAETLKFTAAPSRADAGSPIPGASGGAPGVVLAIQNNQITDTGATDTVTIAIGTNPSGGTLSGKINIAAVKGEAIFSNLSIDKPGNGYTLIASGPRFSSVTSDPFERIASPTGGGQARVHAAAGQYHRRSFDRPCDRRDHRRRAR